MLEVSNVSSFSKIIHIEPIFPKMKIFHAFFITISTPSFPMLTRSFASWFSAIERIKSSVSSVLSGGSLADRWRAYTMEDQKLSADEIFRKMQQQLLANQYWTYDAFRTYNLILFDLYGGNKSTKAKPTQKRNELNEDYAERVAKWESDVLKKMDPSVRAVRQKIKILDAMNAVELASNHKSIFPRRAKKLIAEKAKVDFKEVDSVLLEHDGLRADRKWYQTRMMMNLDLPKTMEERDRLATLDRPFSRTEMELAKEHQESRMKSSKRDQKSPKRITSYVFRTPSKGISRWNI